MPTENKINESSHERLSENIKRDLTSTFHDKGINISTIKIDLNSDNVNIEVFIRENQE